jgi:hypothetical protein
MLGESRLNVYILAADLSPRHKERIQAQLGTALRVLPRWAWELMNKRLDAIGAPNLPLIIEPRSPDDERTQALSLGVIDEKPAARLMPRLTEDDVDWGQDQRYLVAKAVAYLAAPADDTDFWSGWAHAAGSDSLLEKARAAGEHWQAATDMGLFLEMFAAYVMSPEHERWDRLPSVRAFLEEWR